MSFNPGRSAKLRLKFVVDRIGVSQRRASVLRTALRHTRSRLAAKLVSPPSIEVVFDSSIPFAHDVILERASGKLLAKLSEHNLMGEPRALYRMALTPTGSWFAVARCAP